MSNTTDTPPTGRSGPVLLVLLLAASVLLIVAFITFAVMFRPFTIPSSAMSPTLLQDDYILMSRLKTAPRPGDVLIFRLPSDGRTTYVKRLIGVAGDRVQMRGGKLFINDTQVARVSEGAADPDTCWEGSPGQRFRETNAAGRSYLTFDCGPDGELDDTPVFEVPAGHYFFMGDNRDNSNDSRLEVGFVPAANIVGRVSTVLISPRGKSFTAVE